jgi:hypothetical protein
MNVPMIPVEVERAIAASRRAGRLEPPDLGWKTKKPLARAVFFVLTCIGMLAFYFFAKDLVTAVAAIALAEVLIRKRWFFTGVEEALWIGGVFSALTLLPRSGTPESFLVMAAGAALAAARVRNPLFAALVGIFVTVWAEERFDGGTVVAILIAASAGLFLLRTWRRPSTEWMGIAVLLLLPVAGRFAADAQWQRTTIGLYAAFGAGMLALALLRRHHALLLAAILGLAIATTDVLRLVRLPVEAKLAAAGAALLLAAFALTRVLRGRTTGFAVTPEALTSFDDELESAATLVAAPEVTRVEVEPAPTQGGGSFGGAGASGDY